MEMLVTSNENAITHNFFINSKRIIPIANQILVDNYLNLKRQYRASQPVATANIWAWASFNLTLYTLFPTICIEALHKPFYSSLHGSITSTLTLHNYSDNLGHTKTRWLKLQLTTTN